MFVYRQQIIQVMKFCTCKKKQCSPRFDEISEPYCYICTNCNMVVKELTRGEQQGFEREYYNRYPNCINPETTLSPTGTVCSKCENKFTVWDNFNISPMDEKILCADCKGIIIKKVE